MKVLIITTNYPPEIGGVQTHVYEISKSLERRDVNVKVLWLTESDLQPLSGANEPTVIKGELESKTNRFKPRVLRKYLLIKKAINEFQPDIIHGHTYWLTFSLFPIKWTFDIPIVITYHTSHFLNQYYSDSLKLKLKLRLSKGTPDVGIAPSRELAEAASSLVDVPVFRIPNGVDAAKFKPMTDISIQDNEILHTLKDQFVVVSTRRFEPKNGLRYLIESIPMTDEEIAFMLIGDGSERDGLEEWVRDNHLDNRTHFLGNIPNDALPLYYNVANVSILPSLKEAISISALESMSCGTPVIASNVGGLAELVSHGENGLLVEPRDSEGIASAINRLKVSPGDVADMAINARETILSRYTWDAVARETIEVYESVINRD